MATPSGQDADSELGWGVGSVAARLGIAASTLRTWERRYDVGPSRRTAGGHRRYTEVDIARVVLTQLLIARGAPPSDAARVAHSLDGDELAAALDAEQRDETQDSAPPEEVIAALLEAAKNDDPRHISRLVSEALRRQGAVGAWSDIIAPTLIRIGHEWAAGRFPLEAEHLASEVIIGELRAYTRQTGGIDPAGRTIMLASAEDDPHSLPVFALESALAESGYAAHVLGASLPAQSLSDVAARLRPGVVFIWASLPRPDREPVWDVLASVADETTVLLGGPGWPRETALRTGRHEALEQADLPTTVDRILTVIGQGPATRR